MSQRIEHQVEHRLQTNPIDPTELRHRTHRTHRRIRLQKPSMTIQHPISIHQNTLTRPRIIQSRTLKHNIRHISRRMTVLNSRRHNQRPKERLTRLQRPRLSSRPTTQARIHNHITRAHRLNLLNRRINSHIRRRMRRQRFPQRSNQHRITASRKRTLQSSLLPRSISRQLNVLRPNRERTSLSRQSHSPANPSNRLRRQPNTNRPNRSVSRQPRRLKHRQPKTQNIMPSNSINIPRLIQARTHRKDRILRRPLVLGTPPHDHPPTYLSENRTQFISGC